MLTRLILLLFISVASSGLASADDGYRLWLRYDRVSDPAVLQQYHRAIRNIHFPAASAILLTAKKELQLGLSGLLNKNIGETTSVSDNTLVVGTAVSSRHIKQHFSS